MLALVLSSCSVSPPQRESQREIIPQAKPFEIAPVVKASAVLGDAARNALAEAEKAVQAARERNALWPRALELLGFAREAALLPDSEATLKFALQAHELATLGIQQQGYAPLRLQY